MLETHELIALCERLHLSQPAQNLIQHIRTSPPARRVAGKARNVTTRFSSNKMRLTIQAESHTVELAFVYEFENDSNVFEFWDQPTQIKLSYKSERGRTIASLHTPDYFVIRNDGVGYIECKPEEKLEKLSQQQPNRYIRDENGKWRCPPGEEAATQFGFFYEVRSSAEINWNYQSNLRYLEEYFRPNCPTVNSEKVAQVHALVTSELGITLFDLVKQAQTQGISRDEINILIASKHIYIDLDKARLVSQPKDVHVYRDKETGDGHVFASIDSFISEDSPRLINIESGTTILWDNVPWVLVNIGEKEVSLLSQKGDLQHFSGSVIEGLIHQGRITGVTQSRPTEFQEEIQSFFSTQSPKAIAEANRRYKLIEPEVNGKPCSNTRSHRRWKSAFREAEQLYNCGYMGLFPDWDKRGNCLKKMPDRTIEIINDYIGAKYEHHKHPSKRELWKQIGKKCKDEGMLAPSYKTVCVRIEDRPHYQQTAARWGNKAAYPELEFYWELTLTTPRHGSRPFEICHIDHTKLDIELVDPRTGRNLGRPWLTVLMDANSRRVLAIFLSFDAPSYRSCMMVLRECVRRHRRLPATIIVDGGKDFQSEYFESLLARYRIHKMDRPWNDPHYNSVGERLFGIINEHFVHSLVGNTVIMTRIRQVTKSVNPKNLAVWDLEYLFLFLRSYVYEVYDTQDHTTLGQSPRAEFALGLEIGGLREHCYISYDEDFHIYTLPTTTKKTAMVHPTKGIKINNIYYWSESFKEARVQKSQVPVRYDPWNAGISYAFINRRWVKCLSEYYPVFKQYTTRQIELATKELRRRQQLVSQQANFTVRQLASFLQTVEAAEALFEMRLHDEWTHKVVVLIDGNNMSTAVVEEQPTLPSPDGSKSNRILQDLPTNTDDDDSDKVCEVIEW